jgi:hypothetical protein
MRHQEPDMKPERWLVSSRVVLAQLSLRPREHFLPELLAAQTPTPPQRRKGSL